VGLSDGVLRGRDGYGMGEVGASPRIPRCEASVAFRVHSLESLRV
jgi:hypothetical protein